MQKKLLDGFEKTFQMRGLRITQQRLEIFKALAGSSDHPTAEKIYAQLRSTMPTISLDTVYRNLHTLQNHGLINRVTTGQSQARFEANLTPHHHLICKICQKITDISWQEFDKLAPPQDFNQWGDIKEKQVTLSGICRDCLKDKKSS